MQGWIQIFIGSNFLRINDLYICFQIRFLKLICLQIKKICIANYDMIL